jgi:transcriptional regulator with XRE-family HTH domain
MGSKDRALDRGRRLGLKALETVGRELRDARVSLGASQADVAGKVRTSRATESRYESGRYEAATLLEAAELLSVVGLGLSVSTYPLGDGLRDARQAAVLMGLLGHVVPPLAWRTEVPLPNPGDLRSWDAMIVGSGLRTGVEVETVLRDMQALLRRIALKRRDGGVDHLLLVVADTRRNRAVLRTYGSLLADLPRLRTQTVLAHLGAGRQPGTGLILLAAGAPSGVVSATNRR